MDRSELNGGFIFDIQGFSVHDGPGCRTLIFFKGCSLNCPWCSNPEGIHPFPEPLWRKNRCTFDRLCIDACPHKAITLQGDRLIFDRSLCARCTTYECAASCCSGALSIAGHFITTTELLARIRRDRQYWGPGGGITLTGGEPFLQPEFAGEILKHCYEAYIHTAAETCGNYPWENIKGALPYLDWIFFDLKQVNGLTGEQVNGLTGEQVNGLTGERGNGLTGERVNGGESGNIIKQKSGILSNALRLADEFQGRLIFRLPLIAGMTDAEENLVALRDFILSSGRNELNILPGHHLGREKHEMLGYNYYTGDFSMQDASTLNQLRAWFEKEGIRCYLGSDTPF